MSARPQIHLINPLWNAAGGSEWRTVELYRLLAPYADVDVWSEQPADPRLLGELPIRRIDLQWQVFPRGGTFVFVGVYFRPGLWWLQSRPRRTILVYNTQAPDQFAAVYKILSLNGRQPVELVYASPLLAELSARPGIVQLSPIDLSRFQPPAPPRPAERPFTVGRLSRDVPEKHHPDDPALYRRLAAAGCRVRVMGGTCLAAGLTASDQIELLPAGAEPAHDFLRSLDGFLFRLAPHLVETFGRVVFEAMACGLPVVCQRQGGYAAHIRHGENGFLFQSNDEALEIVQRLQSDPDLRAKIGLAARQTALAMYSPAAIDDVTAFYLR